MEEPRNCSLEHDRILASAREYSIDAYTWLQLYAERTRQRAEASARAISDSPEAVLVRTEANKVVDALDLVGCDKAIASALSQALRLKTEPVGDQQDETRSGSANLVLFLVDRSEAAWRLIARWAPESEIATQIADSLAAMRVEVERALPNARWALGAGFDETAC